MEGAISLVARNAIVQYVGACYVLLLPARLRDSLSPSSLLPSAIACRLAPLPAGKAKVLAKNLDEAVELLAKGL